LLTSAPVTLDDFWALIDESATAVPAWERAEWLTERLAELSVDAVVDFETHLIAQRKRVDTWLMWGIGLHLMQGFCSNDGFFYFQPWLIGLGRQTFERVVADPDTLADLPEVRSLAGRPVDKWADEEWPEWEALNSVALDAYERVTGEDGLDKALEARGLELVVDPDPDDEEWDIDSADELAARFPRLAVLLSDQPVARRP
jgi:hypothetical protein